MLVREDGDGCLVIGQASHAWISGQLARAWGNPAHPAPEPLEEVALAAEQHDCGWVQWDLHPTLNPGTGWPHSFLEVSVQAHLDVWRSAPDRLLTQSRYAAMLVSMHGSALFGLRDLDRLAAQERRAVQDYLSDQERLQQALAGGLDAPEAQPRRNQRLLWCWDGLSLAMCLGWNPYVARSVPGAQGPVDLRLDAVASDRFTLEPWPFAAQELEVGCEALRLSGRFDTEEGLHGALADAAPYRLRFTLVAPGGSTAG